MLDISSIQYNAENPNLITVIYTVLCALSLGILIAFTYMNTSHAESRHNHFIQALVLVTIVSATIIQAIGDSVARGLGMLGALSIIRFRTTVRDPRNIVFVFGAIGAGIACGVFGFLIAFVGTIALCLTAFLLKFSSPTGNLKQKGIIDVEVKNGVDGSQNIENLLKSSTSSYAMMRQTHVTKGKKVGSEVFRYSFTLKPSASLAQVRESFDGVAGVSIANLKLEKKTLQEL